VDLEELTLEARAGESGGVGLFPEQLANAKWLGGEIRDRSGRDGEVGPPNVLNLFAHTGLLTLVAAHAGAAVTHVDGARSAVAWARRNAERSGLKDAPIRWIVDDALTFARREARRGRRYDGIVLDPPTYGHGPRGAWQLESGLPELLAASAAVATADPFLLLTAHSEGLEADPLIGQVAEAFARQRRELEVVPLELEADTGAVLTLGVAIRTKPDRRRWSR
jgi:23S rRNA (cytosine1962-C5)-methyltransferase